MKIGVFILVIIMGIAFYWYEYRPSQIRSVCERQSIEQAQELFKQITGKKPSKDLEGLYSIANKEAYYLSCVREQGLER